MAEIRVRCLGTVAIIAFVVASMSGGSNAAATSAVASGVYVANPDVNRVTVYPLNA